MIWRSAHKHDSRHNWGKPNTESAFPVAIKSNVIDQYSGRIIHPHETEHELQYFVSYTSITDLLVTAVAEIHGANNQSVW